MRVERSRPPPRPTRGRPPAGNQDIVHHSKRPHRAATLGSAGFQRSGIGEDEPEASFDCFSAGVAGGAAADSAGPGAIAAGGGVTGASAGGCSCVHAAKSSAIITAGTERASFIISKPNSADCVPRRGARAERIAAKADGGLELVDLLFHLLRGCALADYIPAATEARYLSSMGRPCLIFAAFLTVACGGGDDSDENGASGNISCAPSEFALEGSLNGEAVSHRGPLKVYAWTQIGTGKLDASFQEGGSLHAEWPQLVGNGATFSAAGNITLPPTGPHAGETLAYGSGTFTKLDGGVTFKVSGFKLSVQCVVAPCPSEDITGTLQGCVEPKAR